MAAAFYSNWKAILRALHGEVANLSQVWNQWNIRNINFLRVDRKENFRKLSCTKQATELIISKIIFNQRLHWVWSARGLHYSQWL